MVDLNNLYEDVKARVEHAEQQQMKRGKEVGGWVREVEDMEKDESLHFVNLKSPELKL